MAALFALFFGIAIDPAGSSVFAAYWVGEPALAPELVSICRRESHCAPIGAHAQDTWAGDSMRRKALARGLLDPACDAHRGDPRRFATRGPHGLSAAYSLHHLGRCLPPESLDVPLLSAIAAARRMQSQCERHGACTPNARHRLWVGAGRFDRHRR